VNLVYYYLKINDTLRSIEVESVLESVPKAKSATKATLKVNKNGGLGQN
jgi:hypothetical protein